MPDETELDRLHARIAALESGDRGAARRPPHHRVRSFLAAVLIVIGCVLAPLSVVAAWTSDEVGDTDRYVATVAPLASDPAVQSAVANRVTDAVMDHIDLESLLSEVSPADRPRLAKALGKLGGALENAVRSFVHDRAEEFASSKAFATLWTEANRKIHSAVDKALTGSGGGAVELTDNAVEIDLAPVIDQVKQRLVADGLTVAEKIPEVHTSLTVFRSDDIGKLKTGFRLLQLAGFWLPVLAFVLVAGGVLLSVRRRRAVVTSALAVAVAVGLLGIALTAFRAVYLDRLPSGVSQPAAGAVYDELVRYLRSAVRMVVTLGVVIALAAWLTGPGRRATLVRRFWHSSLASARTGAGHAGLRTGPVGPWARRLRHWIAWILVAGAILAYLLWSHPTAWVVVGLALALLAALALLEFLAADDSGAAAGDSGPGGGSGGGPGVPPPPVAPPGPEWGPDPVHPGTGLAPGPGRGPGSGGRTDPAAPDTTPLGHPGADPHPRTGGPVPPAPDTASGLSSGTPPGHPPDSAPSPERTHPNGGRTGTG